MAATRWAQVLIYGFGKHREDNPVENVVGYQKVHFQPYTTYVSMYLCINNHRASWPSN